MRVVVTVSLYVLAKQVGHELALEEFQAQCEDINSEMPSARIVYRLRRMPGVSEVGVHSQSGVSVGVGKWRARAFHAAYESGADVWLTCDDDIDATATTLRWLIEAVHPGFGNGLGHVPRICFAPYIQRGGAGELARVLVGGVHRRDTRELADGGRVAVASHGGFGLVAMNRAAMANVAQANQHLRYLDDDQVERLALFSELLEPDAGAGTTGPLRWFGEDVSFFRRVPRTSLVLSPSELVGAGVVTVEALVSGVVAHAGEVLDLGKWWALDPKLGGVL